MASSTGDCVFGEARWSRPPSLPGLQRGGLRLRRGAVDLVGEHDVSEDRAGPEAELALGLLLGEDLRADDVRGHQVGRELDAFEREAESRAHRSHDQRLAEAGNAFEQHVTAGEERGQNFSQHRSMADDDLADLTLDRGEALAERFDSPALGLARSGSIVHSLWPPSQDPLLNASRYSSGTGCSAPISPGAPGGGSGALPEGG